MAEKKKNKWIKWVIIAVVVVIVGALVFVAQQNISRQAQALLSSSKNVLVEKGNIAVIVQASGALKPSASTSVYSPLMAEVGVLSVKNGDTVKKDDVLFVLSSKTIDDEIAALQSNLTSQDTQLLMTNKSKSSSIVSPVSGRVKAIYAVVGQETASAMQTNNGLILLSADDKMELRFLPSATITAGDAVTVTIGDKVIDTTIKTYLNGEASIILKDDSYELGASAAISAEDGTALGNGILTVHVPYYVTASEGVVSSVSVTLDKMVTTGDTLIKLKESVYSTSYLQLLASRQNTLDQLSVKLAQKEQLTVRAPQDGVVENLMATQGTNVQEGSKLFSIGSTAAYELVVAVDELDIANIQVGQTANIALDALAGATFTGKITRISGTGNYMNGMTTYDVTVLIEKADKILSGMSARADILVASHENTLLIPISAIKTIEGEKYVMVMSETGKGNSAASLDGVQTKITVGLFNSSQAEILSGLSEGQYVKDLSAADNSGNFMFGGGNRNISGAGAGS